MFLRRLLALLGAIGSCCLAQPSTSGESALRDTSATLFQGPVLMLSLIVPDDQMAILANTHGMGDERWEARGIVQSGTNFYRNVRIHVKGSGSFRPIHFRPSLTLKFPSSNSFFGLTKIHLNNSVHDPGRLNEVLGSELHLQAGVPTPRATPIRVTLNTLDLGVYVLKEGFDKRFLARHFKVPTGNLYDPKWGQDIDTALEADSGPATKPPVNVSADSPIPAQVDRLLLVKAAKTVVTNRLNTLERRLDVDRFLTTMALQILLDDWDGYARHHNNYRLYQDPEQNRFVFMPHGMDLLMGTPRSTVYWPEFNGLVARALFGVPEVPARLRGRMEELQKDLFTKTNLSRILEGTEARLQASLANEPERVRSFYRERFESLLRRVQDRLAFLEKGSAPAVPIEVGQSILLDGWEPWAERPETEMERARDQEGKDVLRIRATTRATYGSWRTRVVLPPGQYSFVGSARLNKVRLWENARDPGVGVRVVPGRRGVGGSGTKPVDQFSYPFRLTQTNEVFLVAEMSAHSGQAEFFKDSLRLHRLAGN